MNIFKQFYKSMYSPKDIAVFRFQGIGKTILYVFFLTLLSLIPAIYYLSSSPISGVDTIQSSLKNELPLAVGWFLCLYEVIFLLSSRKKREGKLRQSRAFFFLNTGKPNDSLLFLFTPS